MSLPTILSVSAVAFVVSPVVLQAATSENAVDVRPITASRIWQTVLEPSSPLTWPWEDGADSAALVVTNHSAGTVTTSQVTRVEGAAYGEFSIDRAESPVEQLYSVALLQASGESLLSQDYARLAFVPGVAGGGVSVRSAREMRKSEDVAVFAYDSAWLGSTCDVSSVSLAWAGPAGWSGEEPLSGSSGYSFLSLLPAVDCALTLAYGDVEEWTCTIHSPRGMMLLFR